MDPGEALRRLFGFEHFRPGQAEAVTAALAGRDALVVMPTGSGKSLCYQLPALMRDDLTLVVSPLVSLMQDQVTGAARGRAGKGRARQRPAGRRCERARRCREWRAGEVRLLYVAPERFASPRFADAVGADPGRAVRGRRGALHLAVGARLPPRLLLPGRRRAACRRPGDDRAHGDRDAGGGRRHRAPAGAARSGPRDDRLRPPEPDLRRRPVRDRGRQAPPARGGAIGARGTARRSSTPGRAAPARSWPGSLRARSARRWLAYHAGLPREVRAATQERFMSGEVRVIVATNAFGMGIDKANVRTVCHATVPGSLEAYYQEAGRAGRDGAPARCLLFAEQRDKGLHVFFIQRSRLDAGVFERVAERLRWAGLDGRYDVAVGELAADVGSWRRRGDGPSGHRAPRPARGWWRRAPLRPTGPREPWFGEWDGRALASCLGSARDAERARWAQYRSVWAYRGGVRLPAGGAARRTSATGRARRRRWRAATCARRRRLRRRRLRPRRRGRCPRFRDVPRRFGRRRRPRRRDPRRGRLGGASGRPHARGRDPPGWSLEGHRRVRLRPARRPTARLPTALERGPRPCRSAARGRHAPLHGRPVSEAARRMNVAVLASGDRHQPPGAARPGPRPRRREDRGGRVRQAGRAGARRARAGGRRGAVVSQ